MKMNYDGTKFVVKSQYSEKEILKEAGCRWNPKIKSWWTDSFAVAEKLKQYADESALGAIEKEIVEKKNILKLSSAKSSNIDVPAPEGESYLPFQLAGIEFIQKTGGRTLLAEEMGLGKSIETIGFLNITNDAWPVLIVCPKSLKLNWKNELSKWIVTKKEIQIIDAGDSFEGKDITIINYDILKRYNKEFKNVFNTIVYDESHFIKSYKSMRTKEAIKLGRQTKYVLCLSGTPILNKPIEGWTVFHMLKPKEFKNFFEYAKRYCGAFQDRWGWNMTGASNLEELSKKLYSTVMIRRLKKDVLKELPPKRRVLIPFNNKGLETDLNFSNIKELIQERERLRKLSGDEKQEPEILEKIKSSTAEILAVIEKMKQTAAMEKLEPSIEFIKNIIEEKKVVVFAHHKFMIAALKEAFGDMCVVIDGSTPQKDRQENVNKFQTDDNIKVFVGSIRAAGVGITLTAASDVVFLEFDWTPSIHTQAEDRLHRIGQENSVTAYYLAIEGSIDIHIAKIIQKKQGIIDKMMGEDKKQGIAETSIFDDVLMEICEKKEE